MHDALDIYHCPPIIWHMGLHLEQKLRKNLGDYKVHLL